jgi:DNA-binding Lrp family transcriptional regulator
LKIDSIDIRIIKLLQQNARMSIAEIARILHISPNAALHRFEKIQKSGIIKKTFLPTFLPQYVGYKKMAYRMQLIIRSNIKNSADLLKLIRNLELERSQIECWETTGHFNIFVWVISEDPINLQLVKDKIQNWEGVQEVKVCIFRNMLDFYSQIDLNHLEGKEIYG